MRMRILYCTRGKKMAAAGVPFGADFAHQPPRPPDDVELKTIIDKLANFVARNGPEFEQMTKNKQRDNAKFHFLFGGEWHAYYKWRVMSEHQAQQQGGQSGSGQSVGGGTQIPPLMSHVRPLMPVGGFSRLPPNMPPFLSGPLFSGGPHGFPPGFPPPNIPPPPPPGLLPPSMPPLPPVASQTQPHSHVSNTPWEQAPPTTTQVQTTSSGHAHSKPTNHTLQLRLVRQELQKELDTYGITDPLEIEFSSAVKKLMETGSKDSIASGKGWIFSHTYQPDDCAKVAKFLMRKTLDSPGIGFTEKIHIIYLVNDVIHHCVRKGAQDLLQAIEDLLVQIVYNVYRSSINGDKIDSLLKVLKIWEDQEYISDSVLEQIQAVIEDDDGEKLGCDQERDRGGGDNRDKEDEKQKVPWEQTLSQPPRPPWEQPPPSSDQRDQQPPPPWQQQSKQEQHNQQVVPPWQQDQQSKPPMLPWQQPSQSHPWEKPPEPNKPPILPWKQHAPPPWPPHHPDGPIPPPWAAGGPRGGPPPWQQAPPPVGEPTPLFPPSKPGDPSSVPPQSSSQDGSQGEEREEDTRPDRDEACGMEDGSSSAGPPSNTERGSPTPDSNRRPLLPPHEDDRGPPFDGEEEERHGMMQSFDYQHGRQFGRDFGENFRNDGPPSREIFDYNHQPPHWDLPPPPPPHMGPGMPPFESWGAPPPHLPPPPDLPPPIPYYDLPAGLMVAVVPLFEHGYRPLDPRDIRLPPPQPPSERLIMAVEEFYKPATEDKPHNEEGWEARALLDFYEAKNRAKNSRYRPMRRPQPRRPRSRSRSRSRSHSRSPPPRSPPPRRRRSRSRSGSRSRPVQSRSHSRSPPRRTYSEEHPRSHSRSRSRSGSPRHSRHRRSRSRSPFIPIAEDRPLPPPPQHLGSTESKISDGNVGHQLLKKMGWEEGAGLGVREQGIQEPIRGGDVRDKNDKYKGIGMDMKDPFELFRKNKSYTFNRSRAAPSSPP